jgi:hypothetical protein
VCKKTKKCVQKNKKVCAKKQNMQKISSQIYKMKGEILMPFCLHLFTSIIIHLRILNKLFYIAKNFYKLNKNYTLPSAIQTPKPIGFESLKEG